MPISFLAFETTGNKKESRTEFFCTAFLLRRFVDGLLHVLYGRNGLIHRVDGRLHSVAALGLLQPLRFGRSRRPAILELLGGDFCGRYSSFCIVKVFVYRFYTVANGRHIDQAAE